MAEDFLAKAVDLFDGNWDASLTHRCWPSPLAIESAPMMRGSSPWQDQLRRRLITEDARLRAAAPALTFSRCKVEAPSPQHGRHLAASLAGIR